MCYSTEACSTSASAGVPHTQPSMFVTVRLQQFTFTCENEIESTVLVQTALGNVGILVKIHISLVTLKSFD